MEYRFVIKKKHDNGKTDVLESGVTENYMGVWADTISKFIDVSRQRILMNTTDYGHGYYTYRVWDYSYTLELS